MKESAEKAGKGGGRREGAGDEDVHQVKENEEGEIRRERYSLRQDGRTTECKDQMGGIVVRASRRPKWREREFQVKGSGANQG